MPPPSKKSPCKPDLISANAFISQEDAAKIQKQLLTYLKQSKQEHILNKNVSDPAMLTQLKHNFTKSYFLNKIGKVEQNMASLQQ